MKSATISESYRERVTEALELYIFPALDRKPIHKITAPDAIEAMSLNFFTHHGRHPDVNDAWAALCDDPPKKFLIERAENYGKPVLILHVKVLGKDMFKARWQRYVAQ